ncbi:phosphoribosyltransferase [Tellurirhabdus rosea]|uniref:phosphoribosyltransferase n=1 Tax=Tellurirhabdus rosea TaxID=2674997 RepID=UPI002251BF04|nr:phosphoribosyltransferase [Tellurirhabdus rosea]
MNLLITSVEAIINSSTMSPYDGIIEALQNFRSSKDGNLVIVVSSNPDKLYAVPDGFEIFLSPREERTTSLINSILKQYNSFTIGDVILLGAKDMDFYLAVNNRVLLLSALYAYKGARDQQKVLSYGIPIRVIDNLNLFFNINQKINRPWFYKLVVSRVTTIYSLTNANTYYTSKNLEKMNLAFQDCLKQGNTTNFSLFLVYFLISSFSPQTVNDFRQIDFWGIYPSSGLDVNDSLEAFKEYIRKMYKGKPDVRANRMQPPILERIEPTYQRHKLGSQKRVSDGCDEQFKTIRINPNYREQLRGATVCIIDDYTTYGTSCETARALLEAAGVKKLIFVALGKFGLEYYQYSYKILGDVFGKYEFFRESVKRRQDYALNNTSTKVFVDSLSGLV